MITLCTPTHGRPDRFERMVASARGTARGPIDIVARVDIDDSYPRLPGVTYALGNRPLVDGYLQMAGLWTEAWQHGKGDIAMMCADDVVFETPGWDTRVSEAMDRFPNRIGLVYAHAGSDIRPVLPFVSREWIDAAGYIPADLQGWFADEWLWHMAAEIGRVQFLEDVMIRHEQFGMDETYAAGMKARERAGGLRSMRRYFYSPVQVHRRDALIHKLREATTSERVEPVPAPVWMSESVLAAKEAREHAEMQTENTLVVVHCYAGDKANVKAFMPVYKHHGAPVLILSPTDAPVRIRGLDCKQGGQRGYYGQVSLDRQRRHLEMLLEYEQEYFLLNDADSMCISPTIPRYLYEEAAQGFVFSNEVTEWRPHKSPYPKIAMQPPYFLTRRAVEVMLRTCDRYSQELKAHPITPYIDWWMLAVVCESRQLAHRNFQDGASFPAWGRDHIPETQQLGHDPKHANNPQGMFRGDLQMIQAVELGAVMLHSIKHEEVLKQLLEAHQTYLRRGAPTANTLTMEEYAAGAADPIKVQEGQGGMAFGDSVRI